MSQTRLIAYRGKEKFAWKINDKVSKDDALKAATEFAEKKGFAWDKMALWSGGVYYEGLIYFKEFRDLEDRPVGPS